MSVMLYIFRCLWFYTLASFCAMIHFQLPHLLAAVLLNATAFTLLLLTRAALYVNKSTARNTNHVSSGWLVHLCLQFVTHSFMRWVRNAFIHVWVTHLFMCGARNTNHHDPTPRRSSGREKLFWLLHNRGLNGNYQKLRSIKFQGECHVGETAVTIFQRLMLV